MALPTEEAIQVGRLDPAQSIFPDVDLTQDGGLKGGVSRRHCRIFRVSDLYFVEDLGSANGTFLDGERLIPHLPHQLEDSTTLQVGHVELEVSIRR